jgi:hypothetical protein
LFHTNVCPLFKNLGPHGILTRFQVVVLIILICPFHAVARGGANFYDGSPHRLLSWDKASSLIAGYLSSRQSHMLKRSAGLSHPSSRRLIGRFARLSLDLPFPTCMLAIYYKQFSLPSGFDGLTGPTLIWNNDRCLQTYASHTCIDSLRDESTLAIKHRVNRAFLVNVAALEPLPIGGLRATPLLVYIACNSPASLNTTPVEVQPVSSSQQPRLSEGNWSA